MAGTTETALFRRRLQYLDTVAHLTFKSLPHVSASLVTERDRLIFSSNGEFPATADACRACGTIYVVTKPVVKNVAAAMAHLEILDCGVCGRQIRLELTPKERGHGMAEEMPHSDGLVESGVTGRHSIANAPSFTQSTSAASLTASTARTSSTTLSGIAKRKRAKKAGSLQALLASKKTSQAAPGFGLDLMDLMKQS